MAATRVPAASRSARPLFLVPVSAALVALTPQAAAGQSASGMNTLRLDRPLTDQTVIVDAFTYRMTEPLLALPQSAHATGWISRP